MSFAGSKPSPSDSCDTLLKKITISSGATQNAIIWRRALLTSIIIIVLVSVLIATPALLPNWIPLYLGVFIGFIIISGVQQWYNYHVWSKPLSWTQESVALLYEKGCSN
jgi:hypothetical protein